MAESRFVYVTFIRTTADKLWTALTSDAFTRQYFFGVHYDTDWKPGSPWKMVHGDGSVSDSGEVLECDKPRRIVLRWRHEKSQDARDEGYGRCVMELEPKGDVMKLTITHTIERENSKLISAVSGGWPAILSNLKSFLESGEVILKAW